MVSRRSWLSLVYAAASPMLKWIPFVALALSACSSPPSRSSAPESVTFEAADGVTVYGDLHLGPDGRGGPLVLAFHQGGGDARGEYGPIVPRLLVEGYSVLAVDQRSGGDRFGETNRTVAELGESAPMCDAHADLEAALAYADRAGFTGPRVAWGSSYSAAHVIRLGVDHADRLAGVLAFSPASGGPMAECQPTPYIARIRLPLLVLRPSGEMEIESVQAQMALAREHGHETFVSTPGAHGSSMLVPARVEGETETTWATVLGFLRHVVDG